MINDFGHVYYLIDDIVNSNGFAEKVSIQINGNGSSSDLTPTYGTLGGASYWTHPCININGQSGWNLASISAAVNGNNYPLTIENNDANTTHNTSDGLLTMNRNEIGGNKNGYNSRIRITQNQQVAEIKTLLLPYRCNNTPRLTKSETSNSASITVHFLQGATIHVSKKSPTDTAEIVNPFDSVTGKVLLSNASRVTLSMANDSVFKTKNYCESYTYFRKAAIENGTFLSYDSIFYINSLTASKFSAYYELTGKYKYQGNTHIYDSTGYVIAQFYLPEVDSGFAMIARGKNVDSSSYNMQSKILTVKLTEGKSDLLIELVNPCQLSCFFPPDTINIDSVFNFSTGTTEILSHDLQVRQGNGLLNITDFSEMSLCPNTILYNKDSVILWSPAQSKRKLPLVCVGTGGYNDVREPKSRINVNDGATLILMDSSYTHIKQGGSIYVAKGGTLIIKTGAILVIGGDSKIGYGELFLDRGANLCIEPGARISFYRDVNDTVDKNLFWIYHSQGGNYNPTTVGVNQGSVNYYKLLDSSFISTNNTCTQLCDFVSVFPQHGIDERAWGFFSSGKPLATFSLKSNYICSNDSVIIETNRVLNEVDWEYEVCELNQSDSSVINNTCIRMGNLSTGGDNCIEYDFIPSRINLSENYNFQDGHLYKLKMKVRNACGSEHDTSQIVFILNKAKLYFNYTDQICEGSQIQPDSFYTNLQYMNNRHIWSVDILDQLVYEDSLSLNEESEKNDSRVWIYDTLINVDFNFPGYYFKGGSEYLISLEVENSCGATEHKDTVRVPLGVKVTAGEVLASNKFLGNPNIQLAGSIKGSYTSYSWSPVDKLLENTTLTPRTNSSDSATYFILTASNGTCSASDSLLVRYNKYLFLGNDTVVCKSNSLLLGNRLEESLLFGLLGTIDFSTYHNFFDNYLANDTSFLANFGLGLLSNNQNLWLLIQQEHPDFFDLIKSNKNDFYTREEYKNTYNLYVQSTLSDFMSDFRENFINNDQELKDLIENKVLTYNSVHGSGAFESLLLITMKKIMDEYDLMTKPVGNIIWYKNGLLNSEWEGQSLITLSPDSNTHLSLFLYIDNLVEYDELKITVDSTIYPYFNVTFVDDSTVYFQASPREPEHLKYSWNFGDILNDTSNLKSPSHTFSNFNQSYFVCLSIHNYCDSIMYCDTLRVDTILSRMVSLGKKQEDSGLNKPAPDVTKSDSELTINNLFLGDIVPNPTKNLGVVSYVIPHEFKSAKIIFMNSLAQEILNVPVFKDSGKIVTDISYLSAGVYYYYLLVDNTKSKVKLMIKE